MRRILVGAVLAASAGAAVAGCGSATTTVEENTVVTIVKTQATPTAQPTPAAQTTNAPSKPQPASQTLPDLVGQRLDVAELHLDERHIRYREVGGGAFGIVVRSNWTVCDTEPAAGATNPGRVSLIVARSC